MQRSSPRQTAVERVRHPLILTTQEELLCALSMQGEERMHPPLDVDLLYTPLMVRKYVAPS